MSKMDFISIIMPAFNRGYIISEAIEAVLEQTYSNWELIIVDDGSADNTKEVIEPYLSRDERISYYAVANGGAPRARNFGVKSCRGSVVTFLDTDDLPDRKWLEILMPELNEQTPIVCCGVLRITPNREYHQKPQNLGPAYGNLKLKFTHAGSYIIDKGVFQALDGFDEKLKAGQHSELGLRVANYCVENRLQIACLDDMLLTVRHTRDDHIRTNNLKVFEGTRYFIDKHYATLQKDHKLLANYYSLLLVRGSRTNQPGLLKYAWKSIQLNPLRLAFYFRLFKYALLK